MRRLKKSGVPGSGNGWSDPQWRAVNSPHRMHLVSMLEALKKSTVAELAELTGRSQQSIYPHLKILVKAGLVRELRAHVNSPSNDAKNERKNANKSVANAPTSRATCLYEFNPALFRKAFNSKMDLDLFEQPMSHQFCCTTLACAANAGAKPRSGRVCITELKSRI